MAGHEPTVVTVGESLGVIIGTQTGHLRPGISATLSFAGAEGNVAIGLARLGHQVAYVSRVGADDVGRMVSTGMKGQGVDVSHIVIDPTAPTAMMLRTRRTADLHRVTYYRHLSAGSLLSVTDIPENRVASAAVLHTSGITLAISDSARAATLRAIEIARESGTLVSFDINYRSRLWSRSQARQVLGEAAEQADIVFGGYDELTLLTEHDDANVPELASRLGRDRPVTIVMTGGASGATVYADAEEITADAVAATAIDTVGAGDAFAAGYLSGWLDGAPAEACLSRAVECGGFAVSVAGDWEGMPCRDEIGQLRQPEKVHR